MKGYSGLFLVTGIDSKERYEEIVDQHITFQFGDLDRFPEDLMHKTYKVKIIGYAEDGKNEGYLVEIPKELKEFYKGAKNPHITVGIANGGKPVDTAKLRFRSVTPFVVFAKLRYFDFANGMFITQYHEEVK